MAGDAVDLVFTDPPYNVDYEGYTEDRLKIKGDKMTAEQFQEFLRATFTNYRRIAKPGASMYVCHSSSWQREFQNSMESAGFEVRCQIIWAKNTFVERALVNSSKAGDIVADLFGGSGSTLIGCERRGRKARLMEIDPKYADCIVRRWQEHVGKEAVLDRDEGKTFEEIATERTGWVYETGPAEAPRLAGESECGKDGATIPSPKNDSKNSTPT
jgi:DNA modification methylase